ncbi:MAG: acylneuraminate cytidylyltransferase family protein [Candidatus Gastranaerophilales bacterium]|nr:acylneuraminate cytidylyltransferase family protein [Candidatus Gastranaerophilales bacterium]
MENVKEILSIIPARGGSKGIPRKNLKKILDKPLIAYTIEASLKSKYITRTMLSSEDDEILSVAKEFGSEVIKRPDELAQDVTKTIPVMIDVVTRLKEKEGYKPDYVVLLQPTCPLRDENYIDSAFEYYFEAEKKGYDSCFSAFDSGYTHAKWKILHNGKLEGLYDYRIRPRRQETEQHYKMITENGAFYALETDTMLKANDFIGFNPIAYITPRVIDIDTPEDFKRVEEMLKNQV